jgi:hypothetical protein
MSHKGRSGSDSTSRWQADDSSTLQSTNTSPWKPRYLPPAPDDSASSGPGHFSNYQSSSSPRGRVTNTDHYCLVVHSTWTCGHQSSEFRRHRLCWNCSNLDVGLCRPEPVEIDKTGECSNCKVRRREDRRHRDVARAAARDRERQQDRVRERSPGRGSTWQRRRSN